MGFRIGAHAMVFGVDTTYTDRNVTKLRLSISKFNRKTNAYEYCWNGFASVLGAEAARRAASLKEKDIITLKDIDEELTFKNNREYVNRIIYDFEIGKKILDRDSIRWNEMPAHGGQGQRGAFAPAQNNDATTYAPTTEPAVATAEDAVSDNLPF